MDSVCVVYWRCTFLPPWCGGGVCHAMIILDRDYAVCFNSFSVAVRQQRAELSRRRQKLSKHTEPKKLARVSGGRAGLRCAINQSLSHSACSIFSFASDILIVIFTNPLNT